MGTYEDFFLTVFGITDGSKPLTRPQMELADELKLVQYLRDLTDIQADYATSGTTAALRNRAEVLKSQLEALKQVTDVRVDMEKLQTKSRDEALKSMIAAAAKLNTTSRRLQDRITPSLGRVSQIIAAGGQKTVSEQLDDFVSNPYLDETGIRMSDEKMHATMLELADRGFFTIQPDGTLSNPELASGVLTNANELFASTRPAYERTKFQLEKSKSLKELLDRNVNEMERSGADLSAENRQNIESEVRAGVREITRGMGDAKSLREERDKLLEGDEAMQELSDVRDRIIKMLDASAATEKDEYAEIIGNPKFRTWAAMHGYDIGTVEVDPKTGKPIKSTYTPGRRDIGAVAHFAAQSRTGLDLRLDRVGRMVRLKGLDTVTVDPLTDRDVPEVERAIVSGLRAGTITAFRFGDGLDDGVFVDTQSGKVYGMIPGPDGPDILGLLDEDNAQFVLGEMRDPKKAQLTAERSKAGQSDADALLQKYSRTQQAGEEEYREITPNARDISRGKVRLQSVATGEIIERDVDGYLDSIEVIEDFRPDMGDRIRAARDRRLEKVGRREAGVEFLGKDDQDPTGTELASMRKREGEGGLQDQMDEALKELEAAQSAYLGMDPETDLRSTDPAVREQAARVLRARETVKQLDARIEDSLAKAGTRAGQDVDDLLRQLRAERKELAAVESEYGVADTEELLAAREAKIAADLRSKDPVARERARRVIRARRSVNRLESQAGEPDIDVVPVFDPDKVQTETLKQADGEPIETGAQLTDATLERLRELYSGSLKTPVDDTFIDVPPPAGAAAAVKAARASGVEEGTQAPDYNTRLERLRKQMALFERKKERLSEKEERAKAAQERAKAVQERVDQEVGGLSREIFSMESPEDREVAVKRADREIARLMRRKNRASRAEGRAEGREEAAKSASERLEKPEMEGEKYIKLRERNPSRSAGGKVVTSPQVRAEAVRPGDMEGMLIRTGEKKSGVLGPTIMSEEDLREFRKRRDEDPDLGEVEGLGQTKDPEEIKRRLKRIQEMRDASLDRYTGRIKEGTNVLPPEEAPDVNQILGLGE